jgi:hypothetical protein
MKMRVVGMLSAAARDLRNACANASVHSATLTKVAETTASKRTYARAAGGGVELWVTVNKCDHVDVLVAVSELVLVEVAVEVDVWVLLTLGVCEIVCERV